MLGTRPVVVSWGASAGTSLACQSAGVAASFAVGVELHAATAASAIRASTAAICFFTARSCGSAYDATSAAGSLEAPNSPVKGKMGYAPAPVVKTDSSGWLYAWSWSIQQASEKKDNAWKFIQWATSKERTLEAQKAGVPGPRASVWADPAGTSTYPADLAEAILDRLLERGTHYVLRGRSYRTRNHKEELTQDAIADAA